MDGLNELYAFFGLDFGLGCFLGRKDYVGPPGIYIVFVILYSSKAASVIGWFCADEYLTGFDDTLWLSLMLW